MNKTTLYPTIKHDCQWYIIDADSKTLGRLATEAARILVGKNLPEYNPSRDIKNALIIINADKIEVTGKKRSDKFYRHHSGQVGGMKLETFNAFSVNVSFLTCFPTISNTCAFITSLFNAEIMTEPFCVGLGYILID